MQALCLPEPGEVQVTELVHRLVSYGAAAAVASFVALSLSAPSQPTVTQATGAVISQSLTNSVVVADFDPYIAHHWPS